MFEEIYHDSKLLQDKRYIVEQMYVRRTYTPAPRFRRQQPTLENSIATPAEEDLLSWILKSPAHLVLCSELTREDFSTPAAWNLFEILVRAHMEHPQEPDLAQEAAKLAPAQKNEFVKLALLQTPEDFDPFATFLSKYNW